jgi:hypothetical protein
LTTLVGIFSARQAAGALCARHSLRPHFEGQDENYTSREKNHAARSRIRVYRMKLIEIESEVARRRRVFLLPSSREAVGRGRGWGWRSMLKPRFLQFYRPMHFDLSGIILV